MVLSFVGTEMMYQHDTTVDHAPACLQLLDVTTMQAGCSWRTVQLLNTSPTLSTVNIPLYRSDG